MFHLGTYFVFSNYFGFSSYQRASAQRQNMLLAGQMDKLRRMEREAEAMGREAEVRESDCLSLLYVGKNVAMEQKKNSR